MEIQAAAMSFYVFLIAITSIVGGLLLLLVLALAFLRLVTRKRDSRQMSEDEGRMLQEIWDGLQKMEDRIANLETILMHKDRKP